MEQFDLHKIVLDTAREFIDKKLEPVASQLDEEERFPLELIKEMGKLNLLGIPYPQKYNGLGLDYTTYTEFLSEVAKTCASTAMTIISHSTLTCNPIFVFGTEEQKQKYLKPMLMGEKIGAFALTEPDSGSDVSSISTTAVEMDDCYILNGSKVFITNGNVADIVIIAAKTAPQKGLLGISIFVVEKGTPGFINSEKKERKLGMRASDTASLSLENVRIPKENLIGRKNFGMEVLQDTLVSARLGMAATAIGISEGALNYCIHYVRHRKQFNNHLYQFQLVKRMLAEMEMNINAGKLLLKKAVELKKVTKNIAKEASEAKLFASTVSTQVTKNAIQLLGAYGCSREYPVERYFRDAKITEIGDGTSEIQYLIIADELMKRHQK